MGKIRVLRGRCRSFSFDGAIQLIQNDQRFNHGFKIRRFVLSYEFPGDGTAGGKDIYGALATHEDAFQLAAGVIVGWAWEDRRQVAWASSEMVGDSIVKQTFELIDPTHVVVRDLYVAITSAVATSSTSFNYYVELEQVDLTDNQAVLAIVQEEAQDVN